MAPRRNTEGNTYEANWTRTAQGYVAWLKRRPRQRVHGTTADELVEQLWEIALEAYGDGEACIDLVPALPMERSATRYFQPAWFELSCNEGFHGVGDPAVLYRKGLCTFCHAGIGGRNGVERVIDGTLKGDLGFVWGALPSAPVVSDVFVRFFQPRLGRSWRLHPCRSVRGSMKRMWELELEGTIPLVCHQEGTHNTGVVCPKCGTARFGSFVHQPIQKHLVSAIARSAVDGVASRTAVVFAGERAQIIVHESLAKRLKQALKGVLLTRLAMLADDEIGRFDIRKLRKSEVGG